MEGMDALIPVLLKTGGPWAFAVAVISIVVTSLIRGWLVPGRTVEREQVQLQGAVKDWRDAYLAEVTRGEVRDAQMNEILQFVRRQPRQEGQP